MKNKAHRDLQDAAEEHLEGWLGKDAADELGKVGTLDRNQAGGNTVDKLLTYNLQQAREVFVRLARGIWPDGRMLGKMKKQVRSAVADAPKVQPKGHTFMWCAGQWRSSGCGVRWGGALAERKVQWGLRHRGRGLVTQAHDGGFP